MTTKTSPFEVPLSTHLISGFVHHARPLWIALGNLETSRVTEQIAGIEIDRPVYVTGLARAGTTILLEFLARHPQVATHKYRDFPGVFVPTWWEQGFPTDSSALAEERAHGDRIQVTPDSPEAIEECLWMAFFREAHRPEVSSVLDGRTENPRFEQFYREHLRKMLFVRGRRRYVAKGNYNLTRLQYLLKLFPDARFVVAVRHPRNHIASLVKQHRLFCNGEANYPRALAYMRRVGHFEFGLDRRPINTGNPETIKQVQSFWDEGEEVRGWARYWAGLYGWFFEQLRSDAQLAAAVQLVRYEDLCNEPRQVLGRIQEHCELSDAASIEQFAGNISAPDYYQLRFSDRDEKIIAEETAAVAQHFDYSPADKPAPVAVG